MYNLFLEIFDILKFVPDSILDYLDGVWLDTHDILISMGFGQVVWFEITLWQLVYIVYYFFVLVLLLLFFYRFLKWLFSIPKKLGGRF